MHKLLAISILLVFTSIGKALELYVSPTGHDNNKGSKEYPFKTIIGARNHIRTLSNFDRRQNITVYLEDGTYQIDETISFALEDSAPDGYTYSYCSAEDAKPKLSSGITISNWRQLNTTVNHLPQNSIKHVWVTDLPSGLKPFYVLYDGDKRLTRARSKGFQMSQVIFKKFASRNVAKLEDRPLLRQIPFPANEIQNWPNLNDIEVFFCPVPWCVNFSPLESVDEENKIAWLKYEANSPPFTTPKDYNPAYIENAIIYLDEPGEWVVDTKQGKIYYWPVNGKPSDNIIAPQLMEYIKVEGQINYDKEVDKAVKNITFKGLTFKHGNRYQWWDDHKGWGIQHDWDKFDHANALLRFRGAENCRVEECHFTASGCSAIRLDLHAQNIAIENNLINYVGHMGILLCGYGPGTKDVNKNNRIVNNIIDHCGEVIWHGHAIFVWQSGENYIAHNLIQNCPRKAIGICGVRGPIFKEGQAVDWDEASKTLRWNELDSALQSPENVTQEALLPYLHARNNLVEYNEIYRCRTKIGDGAALNVSGAGTGNQVNSNILIDVVGNGLRTDDWQRGTTFANNIICSGGIVHKGHNHIINNLFINTNIRFTTYPEQQAFPGSIVSNNVMYFTRNSIEPYTERKISNIHTPDDCILKDNIYYSLSHKEKIEHFLTANQNEKSWDKGSVSLDPLFENQLPTYRKVNPSDFVLSKHSPAYNKGFKAIEYDKIGLLKSYPTHLQAMVFPKASGKWLSPNASISFSSINKRVKKHKYQLLSSEEEQDIEFTIQTKNEHQANAIIDLNLKKEINSIRLITSGKDGDSQLNSLTIWISKDNKSWNEIWANDPYHTKTGRIFDIILEQPQSARYIKVGLKQSGVLTLKHINIYGNE
ncbi:right-handed parallel beta-helix repeat-containing protein [Carboxylicivirga marina]|uniref:Right-handed parallel beta-helix repeat-containing protein n=1 Tax=Carboxylicivirga marina TaxID=2800988 RepID=A0ABS1HK36_9BACT|nr:right-handed parallel beta-helix repeat-containing protein [Carboxylicivirga marina]MBK3517519.1 right-handed parallel beta-helix repeat-containing protein [Carboxylicivirga marina]